MNWVWVLCCASCVFAAEPQTAWNLNQRGVDAAQRGDQEQAEALYRQAIDEWRAVGPAYDAHRGTTLLNLGQALEAEGRQADAGKAYEEALVLERRSLGPSHINTLAVMNYLAGIYFRSGDIERAGALFDEAVPLLRVHYPADVEFARALAGAATVRMREGNLPEASQLAEEGLTVALKAGGENSTDTALLYATVAETHHVAGRTERALPLYRKAIAIYERLLGPAHPRVAITRSQEALVLADEGKLALAEHELSDVIGILAGSCPKCYSEKWTVEGSLALVRFRQGKYDEAGRLLSDVILLQEQHLSRPGPDMARTLLSLAEVRRKERRYDDAARLDRRAAALLAYGSPSAKNSTP